MNINNYIANYADKSFSEVPFNEVDNLIFANLSYISFNDVVGNHPVALRSAAKKVFEKNTRFKSQQFGRMLKLMANSKRFGKILLSDYVEISNPENEEQFSAVTINFKPFKFYVAFRGTDKNIYSWKEDFNMTFQLPVPAQEQAESYLKEVVKKHPFSIFVVGGHSKGGNLAVYGAVQLDNPDKISLVFNNDGPGFNPDFIKSDKYQKLKDKMVTIMPQSSGVGVLLNSEIESVIVFSDEIDMKLQHNGFSWQINDTSFIREEGTTRISKFIEELMNGWDDSLSIEDKVIFINTFYDALISLNIKTTDDLQGKMPLIIKELIGSFKEFDQDKKKMYINCVKAMAKSLSISFIDIYLKGKQDE